MVYEYVEENDINLAELQLWPPYVCKVLRSSNGKSHVDPSRNEKFFTKTYMFDVTKSDELFYYLVVDGQIIVSEGLKIPPLERRKEKSLCKYHNFLGHKVAQCVLFRALVQNALKDRRLKFGDKSKQPMQINTGPFKV